MMTWSRQGMPMISPALTKRRVVSLSSADGSQFPEGWLCYVERRVMLTRWRLGSC